MKKTHIGCRKHTLPVAAINFRVSQKNASDLFTEEDCHSPFLSNELATTFLFAPFIILRYVCHPFFFFPLLLKTTWMAT